MKFNDGDQPFNSLLAQWTAFLDALNVDWEYETRSYQLDGSPPYTPTFWLPSQQWWLNVQKKEPTETEMRQAELLHAHHHHPVIIAVGRIPKQATKMQSVMWGIAPVEYHHDPSPAHLETIFANIGKNQEDWGAMLNCPVCGHEYVHFGNPEYRNTEDRQGADWQGRGEAIFIPMWGECPHSWKMRFGFHKGQTYIEIKDVVENTDDFCLFLAQFDQTKLARAFAKAQIYR